MSEDGEIGYSGDELTEKIISCIIRVHQRLGPGFLESVYQRALMIELRSAGLKFVTEREYLITYDGKEVGKHRVDLVVEDSAIVELKCVRELISIHYAQLRSYLKASGLKVGILVNFSKEKADYRRIEL